MPASYQTDGDPGRRLLLGHAGPDPQAARRVSTRGSATPAAERQRDLPQPPRPRRGDRDRLRPRADRLTASCWSSSSRSTTRRRRTARATTSAPATARRSSTSTTSRSEVAERHHRRRRRLGPVAGQGRHRGDARRRRSGRPSPSTRTTSSASRTATPATSSGRTGSCPTRKKPARRRAALEETTPAWPLLRQKPGSLRPSESHWDANWLGC